MSSCLPFSVALLAAAAACVESPDPREPVCSREVQHLLPLRPRDKVDLLIVLDRTASMDDEAVRLAANLELFGDVLQQLGDNADLHVAVVSGDLGGSGVPGCTSAGDRGAFADGAGCGVDGNFLARRVDSAGRLVQNHSGTLGEALVCLGDLPLSTCPVNQPMGAVVRALDGNAAANDGFRRAGAYLMFLIITDGDDCSLVDPSGLADIADGPAAEVEAAVERACGERRGALADLAATVDFLRPADPAMLIGGVVAGRAAVTPRLASLPAVLPERFAAADIAAENWSDVLFLFGGSTFPINFCVDTALDLAPGVPGTQATCVAGILDGVDGDLVAPLPWCRDAPDAPCLRIVDDREQCPESGAYFAVDARDLDVPRGAVVDVRCELACAMP